MDEKELLQWCYEELQQMQVYTLNVDKNLMAQLDAYFGPQPCDYEGCDNKGEGKAYNSINREVGNYCDYHAEIVLEYGAPEYVVGCPNCGCDIPVN